MSFPPGQTRFQRKSPQIAQKKSRRTYIDPNDFYLMRHRAFLTIQQASELLDVTVKTVMNWEKGISPIPYTAYRVLKMEAGYVFNDEHFKDWFVKGDTFWSPEGRGFKPHELRYISHYFWMGRQWLSEGQAAKPSNPLNATIESGVASGVSPTSPPVWGQPLAGAQPVSEAGTRTPCGVAPLRELAFESAASLSQQERPADFERFLESLGIAA
jgi:DNA-binding XRE family transcriptional regulator